MPIVNCPMLGSGPSSVDITMARLNNPFHDFERLMEKYRDPLGLNRPGSPFRYEPSSALLRSINQAKTMP